MFTWIELPQGSREADYQPFPGSWDATLTKGCRCSEQRQWPDRLRIADGCDVHAHLLSTAALPGKVA
jgi:hypothetical protein